MEGGTERSLERIADSLEKLASDPVIEIEAGPAICPTCGKFNPVVTVISSSEDTGPLQDYILEAECNECNSTMYGVVESWSLFKDRMTLAAALEERAGSENGNGTS